jgi:PITH domain
MPHSHNHGESCAHEAQDIDVDPLELGIQYSLYEKIDTNNVEVLNSEFPAVNVFKSYHERLNFEKYVESDCDSELLFNIPFTGNVKLKAIKIIGPNDDTHPKKLKIFKNRPKMTFDDVTAKADQEFELEQDVTGSLEYSTKQVIFNSVYHLSLYFPTNFGEDVTRIYYIGLRGEFSPRNYHGVTICTYESSANVADHKNNLLDSVGKSIH